MIRNTYHLLARPWHTAQWLALVGKPIVNSASGASLPCPCKGKTCTCKDAAGTIEVKAETQNAFIDKTNIAKAIHFTGNVPTVLAAPEPIVDSRTISAIIEATVNDNLRIKPLFVVDGSASGELETVPSYVCDNCAPLLRIKYRKDGCKTCKTPLRFADTSYVDSPLRESKRNGELSVVKHNAARGNKICNDRLVCRDDKETDLFSRTIAIRYLAKRMVFQKRSNGKASGRQLADGATLHAPMFGPSLPSKAKAMGKDKAKRLHGSSQHDAKLSSKDKHYKQAKASAFRASDVEDVMNDAYIIFKTGESLGVDGSKWTFTPTGNRLHDTCNACRMALQRWQRETYKQTMDLPHYEYNERAIGYRSDINVILRADDVQRMLDVVRLTGRADQATIAKAIGVSQQAISKRFSQLRRRILNER